MRQIVRILKSVSYINWLESIAIEINGQNIHYKRDNLDPRTKCRDDLGSENITFAIVVMKFISIYFIQILIIVFIIKLIKWTEIY